MPTLAQDPTNPLSCRSITAAAAAPTLAPFDARLHPTFTRDSIPTCLEFMLRAMPPSNTPLPACIQRILGQRSVQRGEKREDLGGWEGGGVGDGHCAHGIWRVPQLL